MNTVTRRRPRARRATSARISRVFFLTVVLAFPFGARLRADLPPETYEQRLGKTLPLQTRFTDEAGQTHALGDFFGGEPVVLLFGYWHCPQLCSVISHAAIETLRELQPRPENRFALVYVSIDDADTVNDARSARDSDLRAFAETGAAPRWHYLIGREAEVRRLADAAGFHYRYDPDSRQYAHPSGFLIATPDGKISRYFLGVDFPAEDVAQAMHRARDGKVGASTYELILTCFRGTEISGRYGRVIWHVLQFAVGATVLTLGCGIGSMLWHERRARLEHRN